MNKDLIQQREKLQKKVCVLTILVVVLALIDIGLAMYILAT
jgi:hypothetical protein